MPYDIQGPQGRFDRFLVHFRTNTNLERCPSTDTFRTLVAWAESPYAAYVAANAWAKEQGEALRHVFGIVEWPRSAEAAEEAEHD